MPIISVTSELRSAQQLALCYANRSYIRADSDDNGFDIAKELKSEGYFGTEPVDVVIVSGQRPGFNAGKTDTIEVRTV